MDVKTAIETLIKGLNVAANKGAFNIKDSALLYNAATVVENYIENSEEVVKEPQTKELKKAK
jgi:hypothetical protein